MRIHHADNSEIFQTWVQQRWKAR